MITKTYTERKKKHSHLNKYEDPCLRCGLYEHTTNHKLPMVKLQDGPMGTVLIISGNPTVYADARNSIYHDQIATKIKHYTRKYLTGATVYLTGGVKCHPKDYKIKTHEIRWCSTYVKEDKEGINPDKVIAMGDIARASCKELDIKYESCIHPEQLKDKSTPRTIIEAFTRTGKEIRKELNPIPLVYKNLEDIINQGIKEGYIGLDFEWNIDTLETHTIGVSNKTECAAGPINLTTKYIIRQLIQQNVTLVGHNITADIQRLIDIGGNNIECTLMDTLILKRQLMPHLPQGGLKFFAHNYLHLVDYAEDITEDMFAQTSKELQDYCAADAYATLKLYYWFQDTYPDKWITTQQARIIDMDMLLPVAEMIRGGIKIDKDELHKFSTIIANEVEDILARINTKYNINPSSPLQVLETLHNLGYKVESTGETILKTINHPFAKDILVFRKNSKLLTTYTSKIPEWCSKHGRLHCNLHLASTVTGRMSSSQPNMQNIPPSVRPCFQSIFDNDGILVTVDASQSELRCLAYLSGSTYLIDSYANNIDMHTMVSQLAGISRRDAKTLNFAYIYGASEYRLQSELQTLGLTAYKAKQITAKYLKSMEKIGITDYQNYLLTESKKLGYNVSVYGRIGERLNPTQIVNFPIQSFSADLNKLRIIEMYKLLKQNNLLTRIWLEFHDAMELDVFKPELEQVTNLIESLDTTIPDVLNTGTVVDLPLDIKYTGKNWS